MEKQRMNGVIQGKKSALENFEYLSNHKARNII